MKRIVSIAVACFAVFSAQAQTEVSVYASDKSQSEGITYMLPKNRIHVTVTAVKNTYTPGKYCKYAEQYLRLTGISPDPSVTWTLTQVAVNVSAVPDPEKTYYIKVTERSSAPRVQLTQDGLLWAVNEQGGETSVPLKAPVLNPSKKKLNPQDYFTQDIIHASSTSATARLIAEEIMLIREKRNELSRGELDNMPKDGASMQLMLQQLNEQEEALISLFRGETDSETKQFTFTLEPSGDVTEEVLFRFSQKLGVVAADDLSGAPFYYSLKSQNTVPSKEPVTDEDRKRIEKAEKEAQKRAMKGEPFLQEGIVYNVPERVDFSLYTPQKVYVKQEFKIAQMGNTEVLLNDLFNKKTTFHVILNPEDGSLAKVWQDEVRK